MGSPGEGTTITFETDASYVGASNLTGYPIVGSFTMSERNGAAIHGDVDPIHGGAAAMGGREQASLSRKLLVGPG
jgi:hypothetical protein